MNGPNNLIGWCDYTWNPVKGKCPVACPYCYARRIYDRFGYDLTIRVNEKELLAPYKLKKPAKIFVGSTMELFGGWIQREWLERIFQVAYECPQHIFQFLTKMPNSIPQGNWKRNAKWRYTENIWLGVTVASQEDRWRIHVLSDVLQAQVRFASFEPLLSMITPLAIDFLPLDWVIIGAETGNRKGKIEPKTEWIEQIIEQADYFGIPVFMKDNLKPYWHGELRQEFPK